VIKYAICTIDMAEADVATPPKIFFCHSCDREVTPVLPDYLCSRCKSGFIEEIEDDQEDNGTTDAAETFVDHWDDLYDMIGGGRRASRRRGQPMRGRGSQVVFHFGGRGDGGPGNSSNQQGPSSITMLSPHSIGSIGGVGQPNYMDMFIQQLFSNLGVTFVRGGEGMNQLGLGGVMGDYAMGPNGLDNIITQLLNQLENTGPPPAEKSRIDSLPLIPVTQKMVDDRAECAVCKDEYALDEMVKSLPCDHLFHTACIDPWLELHDSCPTCRCNLKGESPKVDSS